MTQPAEADRKYIIKVITAFCFGWAIIYADRTALYPMLKVIGQEFNLTGTQAGTLTSAYFLAYTAMQMPAGIGGDKYGLKKILVLMYALAAAGMFLTGLLSSSFITLMIFVAIHGLGAGAYYPAAYGTTMNTVPKEMRGLSSAIINSGMSVGLALGLICAGPIYLYFESWKMPFFFLAIPTVVMVFVFQAVLRDTAPTTKITVPLGAILKNKNLMCINWATFCSLYGFWTVVVWGPSFFQSERGLSLTTSGFYTAIVAFAAIPAGLTIGRLSDKVGRKKLSLILLPLASITIFAISYVSSLPLLIVALICYGLFGKLAWDPVAISWVGDHVSNINPHAMGTASALLNFCGMFSSIAAPIVCGWIQDATGSLAMAFYVGGIIVMLGAVFVSFVDETVDLTAKPKKISG